MNRIHSIVFNQATGERQVAHEKARGRASRQGRRTVDRRSGEQEQSASDPEGSTLPPPGLSMRALRAARSLAMLCALASASMGASAEGGSGGGGGSNLSGGGAGGDERSPDGKPGRDADLVPDGGGGGGGGGGVDYLTGLGGAGGAGGRGADDRSTGDPFGGNGGDARNAAVLANGVDVKANISGTRGGNGQDGKNYRNSGGGGGGAEGGIAVHLQSSSAVPLEVDGSLAGGAGGNGGTTSNPSTSALPGNGGGGGGGGAGLVLVGSGKVLLVGSSEVVGGTGGVGGKGGESSIDGADGGRGGNGGIGLVLAGPVELTIDRAVRIVGGVGAAGGEGGRQTDNNRPNIGSTGAAGVGGVGLFAMAPATIVNNGTITGGPGAAAVVMNGASLSHAGTMGTPGGTALVTIGGSNTVVWEQSGQIDGSFEVRNGSTLRLRNVGDRRITNDFKLASQFGFDVAASTVVRMDGLITGFGSVEKSGAGTLMLSGGQRYSGGTLLVAGQTIGVASSFGSGAILNQASLEIDAAVDGTLANTISGRGSVTFSGRGTTRLAERNDYLGGTYLNDGGTLVGTARSFGSGTILNNGTLAIRQDQNDSLLNNVRGGDLIKQGAGVLRLAGSNSLRAITIAEGVLAGSGTALGAQSIVNNGLLLVDGNAQVDAAISGPGQLRKTGDDELRLGGVNSFTGTLDVQGGSLTVASDRNLGASSSLLKLDNATLRVTGDTTSQRAVELGANGATLQADRELILSGQVRGAGSLAKTGAGVLTLLDATNSHAGGTRVAAGTLVGFAGTFGSGAIVNDARLVLAQPSDGVLRNPISGSGSIEKSGAGSLRLASVNDYTGTTTITTGALIGTVRSFGTGAINNLGRLVIDEPGNGSFGNGLFGSGQLVKIGAGNLRLETLNRFTGGTALKEGRLDLGHEQALGTGELAMDDGTSLGVTRNGLVIANAIRLAGAADPIVDTGAFDLTLTGAISGAADLSKQGSGVLTLRGANTASGLTRVEAGTLRAGATGAFSPASAHRVEMGAMLDLAGFDQTVAGLANAGTVSLAGARPGTTLTVTGPFVGSNGSLRLGTVLGDNASISDRLVLSGPAAVASGRTLLELTNVGGLGAPTTGNGIEIVSAVGGATTTAQSTKDAFVLVGGHVDAGAYEYRLRAAAVDGSGESWYVSSTAPPLFPPTPPGPAGPAAPPEVAPPAVSGTEPPAVPEVPPPRSVPAIELPSYRIEVPLLAALPEQLRQAQRTMLGNLRQRSGADSRVGTRPGLLAAGPVEPGIATDAGAGGAALGQRRAWARVVGSERETRQAGTVSPTSKGRLSGLQGGTDLWADGGWRAGLYAGQLQGDMDVSGLARGLQGTRAGSNEIRSQFVGGYVTWTGESGLYVDSVLQGARHRIDARPLGNPSVQGKAKGWTASVEVGKPFPIAGSWTVEPQAQLLHERLSVDDLQLGATRVRSDSAGSTSARIGLRIEGSFATAAGPLQPYGSLDVWRNGKGSDRANFMTLAGGTPIDTAIGGTSTAVSVGASLQLAGGKRVFAEIGRSWAVSGATRSRSSAQGSIGLEVAW